MTDTSKPESVKLDEFKKSFDKRDKKSPSQIRRKGKRYVPKNVLDNIDLEKIEVKPGEIYIMSDGPEFKAKGGRAGYKSGGRGCKLAMKGKGRAYGKNS